MWDMIKSDGLPVGKSGKEGLRTVGVYWCIIEESQPLFLIIYIRCIIVCFKWCYHVNVQITLKMCEQCLQNVYVESFFLLN